MGGVVRFESEQGGEVLVEVDDNAFGVGPAGGGDVVITANRKLEAALATIRPAAGAVLEAVQGLGPTEKQVQFGIKLTGEAGALIAKTAAEANFCVTLTWTAQPSGQGGRDAADT